VRATLDWSYGLLSRPEQLLFERLSAFAGGWTLEAAEAVAEGDGLGSNDVLALLGRLVDTCMVLLSGVRRPGKCGTGCSKQCDSTLRSASMSVARRMPSTANTLLISSGLQSRQSPTFPVRAVDGTVRLWEAGSGQLLASLQGHAGGVWGVALSADGQVVFSGGYDGTVRLWDVSTGGCLHTLRAEHRYERLDITRLTGVTAAQRAALVALGAVDHDHPTD
jgi:WD40 domain-containing protein